MKATRLFRLFLTSLMVLLMVAAISPALAAAPEQIRIPLVNDVDVFTPDETGCSFNIIRTVEGEIRIAIHRDNDGNFVFQTEQTHLQGTFTNADTGKTIPTKIATNVKATLNPDGSINVAYLGLIGRVNVPGVGPITADVGRLVLNFPADGGPPTLVSEHGQHDTGIGFPNLCDILSS